MPSTTDVRSHFTLPSKQNQLPIFSLSLWPAYIPFTAGCETLSQTSPHSAALDSGYPTAGPPSPSGPYWEPVLVVHGWKSHSRKLECLKQVTPFKLLQSIHRSSFKIYPDSGYFKTLIRMIPKRNPASRQCHKNVGIELVTYQANSSVTVSLKYISKVIGC